MRFVSLAPSISDIIATFVPNGSLVGITEYCDEPITDELHVVGTPMDVDVEAIRAIAPDRVFSVNQENDPDQIDEIETFAPVTRYNVQTLQEAYAALYDICDQWEMEDSRGRAREMTQEDFQLMEGNRDPKIRVVYLLWRRPFVTIGGDTYIHDVLRHGGFKNPFGHREGYFEITKNDIRRARPDVIFCAQDPYNFRESPKYCNELRDAVPGADVIVVASRWYYKYGIELIGLSEDLLEMRNIILDGKAEKYFGWPPSVRDPEF